MRGVFTTDTVVMVRPLGFGYNEETARDNEFQNCPKTTAEEINLKARQEFQALVDALQGAGITILILEKPSVDSPPMPDAVFPNNWFSSARDGTLLTYPMSTSNRRAEIRIQDLNNLLDQNGFLVQKVLEIDPSMERDKFLEGTGALVMDHKLGTVYVARSKRCHPEVFNTFMHLHPTLEGMLFDTQSSGGTPIYHTNILLALGTDFAVVCLDCIVGAKNRRKLRQSLGRFREVIEISMAQMENSFCGNILELRNHRGEPLIIMSEKARNGFTESQISSLEVHGEILSTSLETIETIGGGSARCMLAEVFCPRK
jgi:hypothetical protein